MDCGECSKKICTDCFSNLVNLQCPFCRHYYHNKYQNYGNRFFTRDPSLVYRNDIPTIVHEFIGHSADGDPYDLLCEYIDDYLNHDISLEEVMDLLVYRLHTIDNE